MKRTVSLLLAIVLVVSMLPVAFAASPLTLAGSVTTTAGSTIRWTANQWVWWTSGNPGVASIDQNGYITAHRAGQTHITATAANGTKKTVMLTVRANVLNLAGSVTMYAGSTIRWTANQWVWWTSGNPGVASINQSGYITAHRAGKTHITATAANGTKKTITLTVYNRPATPVQLSGSATAYVGDTVKWNANQAVTWTSGYPAIATVDRNGYITAHRAGKANITATAANGMKKTVTFTVYNRPVNNTPSQISGQFSSAVSKRTYTYVAAVSGNHRFDFSIDDVNKRYYLYVYDSQGRRLDYTSTSSSGLTVDLTAGSTYKLVVENYYNSSYPVYTITINKPNPTKVVANNQIAGTIKFKDQEDCYTYVAPRTGTYGLNFRTSDVQQKYYCYIYNSKNQEVDDFWITDPKDTHVELTGGEKYTFRIIQISGTSLNYSVAIGVPNPTMYVTNNKLSGSLKFDDQEDCYIYTAPYTGSYTFTPAINDVNKRYYVTIYDSINRCVADFWSDSSSYRYGDIDLEAGETYKIYVSQSSGYCNYSITIS